MILIVLVLVGCSAQSSENYDTHARLQVQCLQKEMTTEPVIVDCYCDKKESDKGFFGIIFNVIGNILGGAFF